MTVLEELQRREPLFHRPEFGTSRADFERMIADDYWEIGASGNRYDRDFVLDVLEEPQRGLVKDPWETSDFECRQLSADTYLLTYLLLQDGTRASHRATIWQRDGANWRALYHQGTVTEIGTRRLAPVDRG
jgi:hypothetical protein